jgi:hypothetical protein
MTISQDASTPAAVDQTGSTSPTIATAAFSPPANSTVVIVVNIGFGGAAIPTTPTITVKDSLNNTYIAGPLAYDAQYDGSWIFTYFYAFAPGSITVTATRNNTSAALYELVPYVLDGTAVSQVGAASASTFNGTSTVTSFTHAITSTTTGSWVIVGVTGSGSGSALTASGLTADHTEVDSTDLEDGGAGHAVTGTPGSETIGFTRSSAGYFSWVALEILPQVGAYPSPYTPKSVRSPVPPGMRFRRLRQNVEAVPPESYVPFDSPKRVTHFPVVVIRHPHPAPTGFPISVQPPEIPSSEHARFKPPYPRKGFTDTNLPDAPELAPVGFRIRYRPPWPRHGIVAPTGLPVPVQPPSIPSGNIRSQRRTSRLRAQRGSVEWPGTPAVLVQPIISSWIYKRRWTRPLWPRRGVVPPSALPMQSIVYAYNPTSVRRLQRYQWYRRGSVPPTGWPILVQPPMTSQWLRRWSRPPYPRRGVTPVNAFPARPPVPMWERARFKPPYPRKSAIASMTGWPVPVQPIELPHLVRRIPLRQLLPRTKPPKFSAFFIPVQPPERMESVRRWSRPLWPRRGVNNIATFPGAPVLQGYLPLTVQMFTFTPGGAGMDLTTLSLTLFPLNRIGYSFWNPYGDVLFVIFNNTLLPVAVTPNVVRTVELQSVELPQYTLSPGSVEGFGPFPPNDFTRSGYFGSIMTIAVEASQSGVYAGAFRLVNAPPIGHSGPYDLLGARLRKLIAEFDGHSSTPGEIHPGESTPGA